MIRQVRAPSEAADDALGLRFAADCRGNGCGGKMALGDARAVTHHAQARNLQRR